MSKKWDLKGAVLLGDGLVPELKNQLQPCCALGPSGMFQVVCKSVQDQSNFRRKPAAAKEFAGLELLECI